MVISPSPVRVVRQVALGSADYAATLELRRAVLLEPFGIPLSEACADDAAALHWATWSAGACIACLLLIDRGSGTWQLRQMAVLPDWQGQGVGRELVRAAVEGAREAGGRQLLAHARESAVPFYERLGFEVEGAPFVQVGLPHRTVSLRLANEQRLDQP